MPKDAGISVNRILRWMRAWRKAHSPCYNCAVAQAAAKRFGLADCDDDGYVVWIPSSFSVLSTDAESGAHVMCSR